MLQPIEGFLHLKRDTTSGSIINTDPDVGNILSARLKAKQLEQKVDALMQIVDQQTQTINDIKNYLEKLVETSSCNR